MPHPFWRLIKGSYFYYKKIWFLGYKIICAWFLLFVLLSDIKYLPFYYGFIVKLCIGVEAPSYPYIKLLLCSFLLTLSLISWVEAEGWNLNLGSRLLLFLMLFIEYRYDGVFEAVYYKIVAYLWS